MQLRKVSTYFDFISSFCLFMLALIVVYDCEHVKCDLNYVFKKKNKSFVILKYFRPV